MSPTYHLKSPSSSPVLAGSTRGEGTRARAQCRRPQALLAHPGEDFWFWNMISKHERKMADGKK